MWVFSKDSRQHKTSYTPITANEWLRREVREWKRCKPPQAQPIPYCSCVYSHRWSSPYDKLSKNSNIVFRNEKFNIFSKISHQYHNIFMFNDVLINPKTYTAS